MTETTDYSIFKDITSNRELNEKHVKRLMRAISSRNLLHVNPILVSNNMSVIDGQHRLEAAKRLKLPIFYIQADLNRRDISKLNTNQKNWNLMDYINFYTLEGIPEFKEFVSFYNHNREFKITTLLCLTNIDGKRNGDQVKEGFIQLDNMIQAQAVCDFCREMTDKYGYDFMYDSTWAQAMKKAMDHDNFDMDYFKDKIAGAPRRLVPCRKKMEYQEMIEEIYNYKLSKNKIQL